jgi:thioredoxin-dependent peroxiredoxin
MKYLFFLLLPFLLFAQDEPALQEGMEAPDFRLQDHSGMEYTLSDYKGKSPVVVYFYPKANTSGCTKQACAIRDDWSRFQDNSIQVFGISTDSKEDIEKFVEANELNFPLLSDSEKGVSKDYGVLRENGMSARYTFIIDKEGKVAKVFKVTDIGSHSEDIFNFASELN